jgi:hypothetical protein
MAALKSSQSDNKNPCNLCSLKKTLLPMKLKSKFQKHRGKKL